MSLFRQTKKAAICSSFYLFNIRFYKFTLYNKIPNGFHRTNVIYYHSIAIIYFISTDLIPESIYMFIQFHFQQTSPKIYVILQSKYPRISVAQYQALSVSKVYGNLLPVLLYSLRYFYHCEIIL